MTPAEVAATRYNPRLGPFVNDDGDIWAPAEVGGIVAARRKANEVATSTLAFQGMEEVTMSLHEAFWECEDGDDGEDCEFKDDQPCTWTGRAYHFRETGE